MQNTSMSENIKTFVTIPKLAFYYSIFTIFFKNSLIQNPRILKYEIMNFHDKLLQKIFIGYIRHIAVFHSYLKA